MKETVFLAVCGASPQKADWRGKIFVVPEDGRTGLVSGPVSDGVSWQDVCHQLTSRLVVELGFEGRRGLFTPPLHVGAIELGTTPEHHTGVLYLTHYTGAVEETKGCWISLSSLEETFPPEEAGFVPRLRYHVTNGR
jgi:hypothetical protein